MRSLVALRASLSVVAEIFRREGIREGLGFFLKFVVWEDVLGPSRRWMRRYWWLVLIGVLFVCEVGVLLLVLPPADLLVVATEGTLEERLDLGRLSTGVFTFVLASVGAALAIFEIQRALQKPRPSLRFKGLLQEQTVIVHPSPPAAVGYYPIRLRIWNPSGVMAQHVKVRLLFKDVQPFELDTVTCDAMRGTWEARPDLPESQWVFRSKESFRLYGGDIEVIGSINFRLPAELAQDIQGHVPDVRFVHIRAFLSHASGEREEWLRIVFVPEHRVK